MRAKIRDTEIFFDIAGSEFVFQGSELIKNPVVFCLHGGSQDHTTYKKHSMALSEGAQLVMFDYRGCGRSAKGNPNSYTLENNVEDLEALRKYLGLDKIVLIGISYGGAVAQTYARRYQQHVEKLILVVAPISYEVLTNFKIYVENYGNSEQIKWVNQMITQGFKSDDELLEYQKVMRPILSPDYKLNKLKKTHSVSTFLTKPSSLLMNMNLVDLRKLDNTKLLPHIKVPTLVMVGAKDVACSPAHWRSHINELQNAQLIIFKNSGHLLFITENRKYIKAIKNFLRK
ncbi:MAG: alpha/beta hydrolase [Gammaproteobacteria bacterium]|nr:alpha/beta hydrolase [Gammaproteobacteria bacterium]